MDTDNSKGRRTLDIEMYYRLFPSDVSLIKTLK